MSLIDITPDPGGSQNLRGYLAIPAPGFLPKNVDEVMAGACPVVASYGALDDPLRGAPARLEAALRPVLRTTHSGPEPESAADGWHRIETFFAEHLRS